MDTDKATASIELPMEVDSRWVHMDDIEYEKLEWIKDLSKLSAQQTSDDSRVIYKLSLQAKLNFENYFLRTNHYATEWYFKSFYIEQYSRFFIAVDY
ncbi:unnamed protein product [Rotaria magnacalcarata]|uniref:Uncharacterized protein n=1 Tax=Rotaria magnacalcarata TaxID=392030 RepID=A0A816U954_9BILA|nr:unnamed protein product [Rotaria magnacalcarata]